MIQKRFAAGFLAVAACMTSTQAGAAAYFGLAIGQGTLKDWDSAVIDDGSFSNIDVEDSDVGFRILGGNELNENLAFELGYTVFGEATASGNSNGCCLWSPGPVSAKAEADGLDLGLVAKAPTSESFAVFARLGLLMWDVKVSIEDSSFAGSGSDDGNDLFFGFGGEFRTTGPLSMRGEFTRYSLDDSDIDSIAFSLIYRMQ
jgi:OOP family OmpA-OmpF porin